MAPDEGAYFCLPIVRVDRLLHSVSFNFNDRMEVSHGNDPGQAVP